MTYCLRLTHGYSLVQGAALQAAGPKRRYLLETAVLVQVVEQQPRCPVVLQPGHLHLLLVLLQGPFLLLQAAWSCVWLLVAAHVGWL